MYSIFYSSVEIRGIPLIVIQKLTMWFIFIPIFVAATTKVACAVIEECQNEKTQRELEYTRELARKKAEEVKRAQAEMERRIEAARLEAKMKKESLVRAKKETQQAAKIQCAMEAEKSKNAQKNLQIVLDAKADAMAMISSFSKWKIGEQENLAIQRQENERELHKNKSELEKMVDLSKMEADTAEAENKHLKMMLQEKRKREALFKEILQNAHGIIPEEMLRNMSSTNMNGIIWQLLNLVKEDGHNMDLDLYIAIVYELIRDEFDGFIQISSGKRIFKMEIQDELLSAQSEKAQKHQVNLAYAICYGRHRQMLDAVQLEVRLRSDAQKNSRELIQQILTLALNTPLSYMVGLVKVNNIPCGVDITTLVRQWQYVSNPTDAGIKEFTRTMENSSDGTNHLLHLATIRNDTGIDGTATQSIQLRVGKMMG